MAAAANRDRVGIGWRPELAAGILTNLDRIDIIEVIADDYFNASRDSVRALETLAAQAPLTLHGVSMGLASTAGADDDRLAKMARLFDRLKPESWSEHLAFVRAGGIEIGHLAAPPRTPALVDATAANLYRASKTAGVRPMVENIATLIDPPASTMDEPQWLSEIVLASGCRLLLDLHNLYANAVNFGMDPRAFLHRLPLDRVGAVHIAGGKWIGANDAKEGRILDDHLHPVPDPVFDLLEELAAVSPHAITVVLERDGNYPPMRQLLAEMGRARASLAAGRAKRAA